MIIKNNRYQKILVFTLAFAAMGTHTVYSEDARQKEENEKWLIFEKKEAIVYDFSNYGQDPDVKFSLEDEQFKLDKPTLRKGEEMWVSLDAVLPKLGAMLLKIGEDAFIIIRDDGTPLEFKVGEAAVKVNKITFLNLDQAPKKYSGDFFLTMVLALIVVWNQWNID